MAALTGGEIFVAAGADLVAALESAVCSLKIPHQAAAPMDGPPQRVAVRRGGMTISARWQPADTATGDALALRAVAAMAASLALPAMATESAAALAEDEGLVTHLTSLVLEDENGDIQQTVPAMRKVPLPSPRTRMASAYAEIPMHEGPPPTIVEKEVVKWIDRLVLIPRWGVRAPIGFDQELDLYSTMQVVDWDLAPQKLQSGDLSMLASAVERAIRKAATNKDVVALARTLDLDPVVLVVGMLAHAARSHRTAARIARAIFGGEPPAETSAVLRLLGIERLPA